MREPSNLGEERRVLYRALKEGVQPVAGLTGQDQFLEWGEYFSCELSDIVWAFKFLKSICIYFREEV